MTIPANIVYLFLSLLIPLAVATLTKLTAPDSVKTTLSILLAAFVTLITNARTNTGAAILSTQTLFEWGVSTAVAIASYHKVYKKWDVNNHIAPEFGLD